MNSNKILFITSEFPPQPGGIGVHAHHLSLALSKKGKDLIVLTDRRSKQGIEENDFDVTLPFKVKRINRYAFLPFTYCVRVLKALLLVKQSELVLVSGKFSLWTVFFLKKVSNKKVVAIIHGTEVLLPNARHRSFTYACLQKCDAVIAVSNYTKSLVAPLSLKKVVVIPNGIIHSNPNEIQPKKFKTPLNLITVGNVTQRKGQHNVVKTLPKIVLQYPDLHYDIVGIPSEREAVITLANSLKVSHLIHFHGKVSEAKKIALLKESSIFIMLSEATMQGDVEGFGIAILEANMLGIPAIGALGCGIEDAISNYHSGILVPLNDVQAIVDALDTILVNYETYSKNAIAWSHSFDWDILVGSYLKVFNENV